MTASRITGDFSAKKHGTQTGNLNLLKLTLIGVWMGLITMAAIYASATRTAGVSNLPAPAQSEVGENFKTEHIAVAIFLSGKVRGYFTVRVECKISHQQDKEKLKWVLANDLHKAVYTNNDIKYEKISDGDIDKVTKSLKQYLDKRESDLHVTEVRLSEVQFLSRI
jgi:hypothetical protein